MILLFSSDSRNLATLRAALAPVGEFAFTPDWVEVARAPAERRCSVVYLEWLPGSPYLPRLVALKARHPRHPVVLVTCYDEETASLVEEFLIEEVVWWREIQRQLAPAAARTCSRVFNYVRCLAVPFREAEHLPHTLREAIAHACEAAKPVKSVGKLAVAMRCSRGRLWYQWTQAAEPSGALRLEDFLHWILLLRAVGRKTPGRPWAAVAKDVGVSPSTLTRWARRLAGRTLDELADDEVVIQIFRQRVYDFLLGAAPLNKLVAD